MTPTAAPPTIQPAAPFGERLATAEPALLHEFFDRAARRWPERTAIEVPPTAERSERRLVTYAALKRQADGLAHFLGNYVQQEECIVVVMLPRDSEHLYVAQLAALKAGAAYASIDPAFPDEQVSTILDDATPVAVLTDRAGLARVRRLKPGARGVNVIDWLDRCRGPVEPIRQPAWLTPHSLAYLIYTSGTTGRPKGVMIEHRSIVNLVQGDLATIGITPQDRFGQSSSAAYDSSVEETWTTLAAGATLVVMDDHTTRLGPDLIAWLRRERVSAFMPSPTLLRSTGCEHPENELPDLRLVHVGGEALSRDLAERWARGCCLINDYGPTECTVMALRGRIQPGGPVTIGKPIPGIRARVLNDALEEVSDGESGELCLGGIGLARGYRNQPALTAQKFPHHPRLGRIYRTGDLVRREPDGTCSFHGRIDAQVKVRGYRIELEAIEARLVECHGVRAAACQVQGDSPPQLVAFIVPANGAPPSCEELKTALRTVLPAYMVPSRFGFLPALPTTVSGKLNRKGLPLLDTPEGEADGRLLPRNRWEEKLAAAVQTTLRLSAGVSVDRDFFNDLGGDSLSAAQLISLLRDDPTTAALTVRDLYEARTIAELATRIPVAEETPVAAAAAAAPHQATVRPMLATLVQTLWLVFALVLGGPLAYLAAFDVLPSLLESLGLTGFLLIFPLLYAAALPVYAVSTVALAVLAKKLLIGRYQPMRAPVWGSFYVRNWMVQRVVQLVPWRMLEGTVFELTVLRALGARIGRRVHIHRGVNLRDGGWDLLVIEDNVTLSQDVSLRLVELENGEVVVGPITIEAESTLDVRAGVAGNTHLEEGAYLNALSFLPFGGRIPRGERWEGVPARFVGTAPREPRLSERRRDLSPGLHGLVLSLARSGLTIFEALPALALVVAASLIAEQDADSIKEWFAQPSVGAAGFLLLAAVAVLSVPVTLLAQLAAVRLLGRVHSGAISRWSVDYVRVWLKARLVESAGGWLSGSLLWPVWLRWAGMSIGPGCEISSIFDTIPELVEVGSQAFLADGIYLGGPRVHRGTVTLAPVRLGDNTYFGNRAVIAAGQTVPNDVLLGVCTVADDRQIRAGTSWFGQPPFELPRREVVPCDQRLTYAPGLIGYLNRVFWEGLLYFVPVVPLMLALAWAASVTAAESSVPLSVLVLGVIPSLDLAVMASLVLMSLVLKWTLLGRVRPGVHPLWSSWCRRWEFHYNVHHLYAAGPLSTLEGTLLLNWCLRAMGIRIGRHVVLSDGFAHVIDYDMLAFEDGATVGCDFQAHTFEDRVLKIDRVAIRRHATVGHLAMVLYGADIGAHASVAPHSVVMKHERLMPGRSYAGCPTRLLS